MNDRLIQSSFPGKPPIMEAERSNAISHKLDDIAQRDNELRRYL